MATLRVVLLAVVLTVVVFAPQALAGAKPSRAEAVGVLNELHLAGLEAVLAQFHAAPEWNAGRVQGWVTGLLGKSAISRPLIGELARQGLWGRADKLFGKDRLRRRAVLHDVKPDDCYAIVLKNGKAEVVFCWDGKRLQIIHYSVPGTRQWNEKYVGQYLARIRSGETKGASSLAVSLSGLGRFGPDAEEAIPEIMKQLAAADRHVRVQAAIALWRIDRKSSVSAPPLIEILADTKQDAGMRAKAADGLGIIGPHARSARAALLAATGEKSPVLRASAVRALWKITGDLNSTLPVVLDLLKNVNLDAFAIAAKTLAAMGTDKKSPVVLRMRPAGKITVGFALVGSESDWQVAHTLSIKFEARSRGVDLHVTDTQQKQENQIKALRYFIEQKVDVIAFSPVVATGWGTVLKEVKAAGIPVILTDRAVDVADSSLYVTLLAPDFVEEGRRAARWFVENTKGELNIFELRGTPGAGVAIERKKGFDEIIAKHARIKIIKGQDGDFTRAKGKEVTEAFLKTPQSKKCNALYAHNDDMAIGAIGAIKAAGLKPGKDIKIVSIDAVKAAFEAMVAGELNCTVECNPLVGVQLLDIIEAVAAAKKLTAADAKLKFLKPAVRKALGGEIFAKRVAVKEGVFDQSVAKKLIDTRVY